MRWDSRIFKCNLVECVTELFLEGLTLTDQLGTLASDFRSVPQTKSALTTQDLGFPYAVAF